MSGIGIIFHRDGRPVERDDLERLSRSLAMYGPEKRRVKSLGEVGFAYTHFTNTPEARLGSQPIVSRSGRYTLVFDGRIDNREDIAAQLALGSSQLGMLSDAALALALWEKSGIDGLNQWVGEFAAILWDQQTREVIALRDHFGRRPLHYHLTDKRLVVASMPKGIHALGDVPRELDRDRLTDVLSQFDIDLTRSYYRYINLVAPATVMRVSSEREAHTKYYSLKDHIRPVRYKRDQDYVDAAEDLFGKAMKACLRSPGKVGSHLSSGMDSSLVSAMAARHLAKSGQRLSTYTWVPMEGFAKAPPQGVLYDESPAAHAMADMYPNIDTNYVGRDGPSVYQWKKRYQLAAESVARNELNLTLGLETARMAAEQGVKVMLCGTVGNISLSYEGQGLAYELLRTGKFRTLFREINAHKNPRQEWRNLLKDILPRNFVQAMRRMRGTDTVFQDFILRRSAATAQATKSRAVFERTQALGFSFIFRAEKDDNKQWITFLEHYNGPAEANFLAAMPALFGQELRDPMFDRRLLEWRFGVPISQFRRDGKGRFLMRRLMKGKVPDIVIEQQLGRGVQSADWHGRLAPDLPKIKQDLELSSQLESVKTIIDHSKFAELIDAFDESEDLIDANQRVDYMVSLPLAASVMALAIEVSGTNQKS
ncbi:MAG: asparagine synthetase B family protein [Pseudomonadota bacterium]